MLPFPNSTLSGATRPHHPLPATTSKNCQGMTFHQVQWYWGNHHHLALDVPVPNLHVWQCRLYVCKYCRTMDRAVLYPRSFTPSNLPSPTVLLPRTTGGGWPQATTSSAKGRSRHWPSTKGGWCQPWTSSRWPAPSQWWPWPAGWFHWKLDWHTQTCKMETSVQL